jgi:hypothetical protein
MEPRGGSSGVKPVDVDPKDMGLHEIDSSELSASTASNTMLPQLEVTDAEKAQLEEERRKRKKARKAKREAREKKKEQKKVRRQNTKKRRKKAQERSKKEKKRS